MKNLKKISLISFLACATLAGGILTANTEVETPVAEKYFRMEVGAQVRVPDEKDGELVKDGLRFTAVMSDAYRKDVGELDALSVGMFIMPAAYASKPINYDNCFGESACYYWGDYQGATEGKKEILHVESYAYEEEEGADYLTMKASVWNMNPENLDKEFVAVAYVTDGMTYHWATPAQGAKAVSVAQKALLNPKDEIHTVEGGADRVNAAYVNAYLESKGGSVEVAYKETIYKQQKDGSYALIEENVEKTGVVKAYNTQAPKAYDNYAVYSRESTARDLLIDGSAVITTYYNYTGNRVVLWDGDEYLSDSSYVHRQIDEFAMQIRNSNTYEGKAAWMYNTEGWEGPWWKAGKVLPAATDTFSMIMEMGKDITTGEPTVYQNWDVYLYYTSGAYVMPTSMTFENLETGEVTEVEGAVTNVATGLYRLTMKFASSYSAFVGFGFRTQTADGFPVWYMDNLCAENIKVAGEVSVEKTYSEKISFNAPKVIDTTIWEGETSEFVPTVQYKSNLATDYSDLTAQDGVYTITPDAEAYKYEIVVNGESHITVKGHMFADFSIAVDDRDIIAKTGHSGDYDNGSDSDVWVKSTAVGLAMDATDWHYAEYKKNADRKAGWSVKAGFVPTKIGMWVYTPTATTLNQKAHIWLQGLGVYGAGDTLTTTDGAHVYYEVTFSTSIEKGYGIGFAFTPNQNVFVTEIVLIA